MIRATWLIVVLAALGPLDAIAAPAKPECHATDGDSLRCGKERVRVRNVYAAELKDKGGPEAKERLQKKIDSGKVTLDRKGRDKYGRTIAEVRVNGKRVEQRDIGPRCGRGIKKPKC